MFGISFGKFCSDHTRLKTHGHALAYVTVIDVHIRADMTKISDTHSPAQLAKATDYHMIADDGFTEQVIVFVYEYADTDLSFWMYGIIFSN